MPWTSSAGRREGKKGQHHKTAYTLFCDYLSSPLPLSRWPSLHLVHIPFTACKAVRGQKSIHPSISIIACDENSLSSLHTQHTYTTAREEIVDKSVHHHAARAEGGGGSRRAPAGDGHDSDDTRCWSRRRHGRGHRGQGGCSCCYADAGLHLHHDPACSIVSAYHLAARLCLACPSAAMHLVLAGHYRFAIGRSTPAAASGRAGGGWAGSRRAGILTYYTTH